MTQHVFISNVAYSLGTVSESVDDAVSAGRTNMTVEQLRTAGFEKHWMADSAESSLTLAESSLEQMELAGTEAIIHATCVTDSANLGSRASFAETGDVKHLMDFPVSRLQSHFDLQDASLIGLNQQACTGMLGSLRIARALILAENWSKVVCVTSDRFPQGAIYEQAYCLISDGAAGCVVSRDEGEFRLLATHHIANGALVGASDDEIVGSYFNYTHRLVVELAAKASILVDEIDWVVPQNTNIAAWQVLARLLRLDQEKVWCPTLPEVGHVISGDNLINLASLTSANQVASGERLLLTMAGYGMNWQGVLLEKT